MTYDHTSMTNMYEADVFMWKPLAATNQGLIGQETHTARSIVAEYRTAWCIHEDAEHPVGFPPSTDSQSQGA